MWRAFYSLLIAVMMLMAQGGYGVGTPAQAADTQCPSVTITCPSSWSLERPSIVSAQVSGAAPDAVLTYNWTISAGTIMSGQGTSSITIDTSQTAGKIPTTTVEVGGIPNCPLVRSCSFPTHADGTFTFPEPRKFDRYSRLTVDEEKQRLDNFAAQLLIEPETKAYIIVYTGERTRAFERQAHIRRIKRYLIKNGGIDSGRIFFADGGTRESLTFELTLLPPDVTPTFHPIIEPDKEPTTKSKTRAKGRKRSHKN